MSWHNATPEEFVRAWQESASVAECAKRCGITPKDAATRASVYRAKGVPLKRYHAKGADYGALAKLAKSIHKE